MKSLVSLACCFTLGVLAPVARAGPEESVVKVFASIRFPNPTQPWMKGDAAQNIGTGVIIEGNRILIKVSLPVTTKDNRLVRAYEGEPLAYFIHGPLVFALGKTDDFGLYAQMNRTLYLDNSPLVLRKDDMVRFPGEELVVVSARMFAHPIARGYGDPVGKVVKDVNGTPIKNLRHLVETIRDCTEEFLTFNFADNWSEAMVFDRKEMAKATEEIMEDNGIAPARRGSAGLLKIWNAK